MKTAVSEGGVLREYYVRYLDAEQCSALLSPLGLQKIRYVPFAREQSLLWLNGTPEQLNRARQVLDVVDSQQEYCIVNLGPASEARTLPAPEQIEMALGNISVGTFEAPPARGVYSRAIIGTQGGSILAFLPVSYRDGLRKLLERNTPAMGPRQAPQTQDKPVEQASEKTILSPAPPSEIGTTRHEAESKPAVVVAQAERKQPSGRPVPPPTAATQPVTRSTSSRETVSAGSGSSDKAVQNRSEETAGDNKPPKTVKIVFKPIPNGPENAETKLLTDRAMPSNGEDLIDMTLPETITLVQLLDLAGKYMSLNYVYDPREIPNQSIALKLHGNLQGEMKVKNLYALLETVLGDLGYAMIRQQENLISIVKIDKALQTQPELVDTTSGAVQVGDTVVTRAFNIKHIDILSVITLLQDMKLSVAVTAFEKSNLLLVTCHADRMNRVEQLVEKIDRPGEPVECRFRRLDYTAASPLVGKLQTLAQELESIDVTQTSGAVRPPGQPGVPTAVPAGKPAGKSAAGKPVYLDIDERTNRILMIGYQEELAVIEQLIDTLDIAQEDPRAPHIYNIENIDAEKALEKLREMEVLKTSRDAKKAKPVTATAGATSIAKTEDESLTGEPLVSVLEATNQLLVRATPDQHARIGEFLDYIDVVPGSTRTLAYYAITCIRAETASSMLEKLGVISGSAAVSGPNEPSAPRKSGIAGDKTAGFLAREPQVVVSESTNGLLVNATAEQHEQIADVISLIDRKMPEEELSVQTYPVENSSPEHISEMLDKLLVDTKKDKEGKVEKIPKTEEQITVVPDPNTYSLIVYASQKNQQWIKDLITRLDKRRPQVLIDVTLVEVTRTDSFEYDLNIVANARNAVTGNIVIDSIQKVDSGTRLEGGFNLPDQDGNPTGQTKAFYSDEKVQALLTAIQRKNYGRVLAKPKILVDDGQEGQIVTTDTTTYVKESIQIPQTGTPITTRDFFPIDASIELLITPHISEGDLLRLTVSLSREDFGSRPLSGAPPDITSSKVDTTVFVPDDNTVILGGLVKLNQSKGGSKVPLLGDVPVVGGLFRSINNSDVEKKLYVFLKANIVRPYEESKLTDLRKMSEEHQEAFEKSEAEFQKKEDFPGIRPQPMPPDRVLQDYR